MPVLLLIVPVLLLIVPTAATLTTMLQLVTADMLVMTYMQCLDAKRLVAFSTAWHVSVLSVLVLLVMLTAQHTGHPCMVTGTARHGVSVSAEQQHHRGHTGTSTLVIGALVPLCFSSFLAFLWVFSFRGTSTVKALKKLKR